RSAEYRQRRRVVAAEDQERDRDGQQHDQAAHRRRAGLAVVPGRPLLADLLAELLLAQVLDELRAEEHAQRERRDARDEDLAEHLREHPFQPCAPRTLDQNAIAPATELLEQRAGLLGRADGVALALESVCD